MRPPYRLRNYYFEGGFFFAVSLGVHKFKTEVLNITQRIQAQTKVNRSGAKTYPISNLL